jgi:hypothetical protein
MRTLIVILSLISTTAFSLPAANADIHDCVNQSRSDGSNIYAMAQLCAGVQNVKSLRDCVDQVRHLDGFDGPNTAAVCSGVKDVQLLRDCIVQERKDGFNDVELSVLCSQR